MFPLHPPTAASGLAAHPGQDLVVEDLAMVLARVQAAGPPAWLIEGVWPRDAHGVFAAEDKAGKTWAILDLAVSVAAGAPLARPLPLPTLRAGAGVPGGRRGHRALTFSIGAAAGAPT